MKEQLKAEAFVRDAHQTIEQAVEEFGNQFDELNMKPPKNSMPGLERELLKDFMRKALQAQRDAGYQQCLLEIKHEQRKLLDGFSHPKDCAMCLTPPTNHSIEKSNSTQKSPRN